MQQIILRCPFAIFAQKKIGKTLISQALYPQTLVLADFFVYQIQGTFEKAKFKSIEGIK